MQQIELPRAKRDRLVLPQQAPRLQVEAKRTEGENGAGRHVGILVGFRLLALGFSGSARSLPFVRSPVSTDPRYYQQRSDRIVRGLAPVNAGGSTTSISVHSSAGYGFIPFDLSCTWKPD